MYVVLTARVYAFVHMYTSTYECTCMNVSICVHVNAYMCDCAFKYVYNSVSVCLYVCEWLHVCRYVYMYVCKLCMYVCIGLCISVCMCIFCMHVGICSDMAF